MERRILLLGLSTAAAPLLATAIEQPAHAQGATLGLAKYRRMTMQVGGLSKEMSSLAMQRAQNPRVKQFAGFEFAEQVTIAQVLTDEQSPPPPKLDASNAAILRTLEATGPGPEFDRQYVASQLAGHHQLFEIQDSFLKGSGTMRTDTAHVAMLARTVIQMHLTMLTDLQNVLRV